MAATPRGPRADGGRVVPHFAVTNGRTRAEGRELPLESMVTVTDRARARRDGLAPEYRRILDLCAASRSLVELGALLEVPIGVARVLVGDLVVLECLTVHLPLVDESGRPRRELLERLLDGLRAR